MKKFIIPVITVIALILNPYSFGQSIDPSLIENLSPDQIELVKSELQKTDSLNETEPQPVSESTKKVNFDGDINDSNNKKYGYDYFSSIPTSIAAVGDLPLPNDYKISLNDQLTIILSGSKEEIFDLNVNLDGTILFPELGSISVVGETFQDVKNKLANLIDQSYIGVRIDLSLKNLSAKKITIVGAVKTPGTYLVNPFSTISSALGYSGGISEIGTLRKIKLSRVNGETYTFDLYKLLISGDRSDDITIESGDVIVIDPAEQFINVAGQVKRPAIYEMVKGETLNDLIKYALGFTQIANETNIDLGILDIKSSSVRNINVSSLEYVLSDVLSVNVNPYVSKDISNIRVDGAIKEPGFYSINENKNLEEIINKLDFVDVYPWLAVLEQFDDSNLIKTTTLFNLKDPDTYRSVEILPNSKIFFADINSREFDVSTMTENLIDDFSLQINHRQGNYSLPVFGKFDVSSFIKYLGLDMSDVDDVATYISPVDNIIIKDDYRNMQFIAKKYNTISFRSPVNNLITVSIQGAINFPGTYTMTSNSVISDLYEQIGGFKPEAFMDGIIFKRESVKIRQMEAIEKSKDDLNRALLLSSQEGEAMPDITIITALSESIDPENLGRVAGNFSPQSLSSNNTILLDGDTIIVPVNPNIINVIGEVLNPIAFEYKNNVTVMSAIDNAGGLQDFADKRKIYVIKANGMIEKPSRNIFTGYVKLEPGDTIVVPRKFDISNPALKRLLPITSVLSDLAFSAAALENLSNSN